jgi:hypothetical protein
MRLRGAGNAFQYSHKNNEGAKMKIIALGTVQGRRKPRVHFGSCLA